MGTTVAGAIKPHDITCDDGCCYADLFDVTHIVAIIRFFGRGLGVLACRFMCCVACSMGPSRESRF